MSDKILWVRKKILSHASLFVMVLSSGFLFLSSIYLFSILSSGEYVVFSMLIVFASLTTSFGALGSEQTLLRLSHLDDGVIYISKSLVWIVFFGVLIGCLFLSYIANATILNTLDLAYLMVFSIIYSLQMILYNILRLCKSFIASQIVNNLMKLLIPLFILGVYFIRSESFILYYFTFVGFFSVLFGMYSLKHLNFCLTSVESIKKEFSITFSFLFSMFVILLLNYIDKMYISKSMSESVIASYMLMQNIFLSPLLILSSYFGFKSLVKYKDNYSITKYVSRLKLVSFYSASSFFVIFISLFMFESKLDELFNYQGALITILLLLALGFVRVIYSDLSAAMGAIGVSKQIFYVNAISMLTILLVLMLFYFSEMSGVNLFLVVILFLWVIRCVLYYLSLRYYK